LRQETFEEFARESDLHTLSHRGLTQELIPGWLETGERDLDGRIVSSAYGETPLSIQERLVKLLSLHSNDIFLDVGAGGGGVLARMLGLGISAFGVEQNRLLVEAGQRYLKSQGFPPDRLSRGDFLTCPWPEATKIYSATSRYSQATLRGLALRIQATDSASRVVTLGKELYLSTGWTLEHRVEHRIRWNRDEAEVPESLCSWVRNPQTPPATR
jgi:hypothetical protein